MNQRLARDPQRALLGGVCAGIASQYGYDVTVVRVFWLVATVLTSGLGAVVYLAAWLGLPRRAPLAVRADSGATAPAASAVTDARPDEPAPVTPRRAGKRRVLAGVIWMFIGLLLAQVYLAGLFLMGGINTLPAHEGLGWSLTYYPFITLIVAAVARMPRAFWISYAVLFVAVHAQPFLTFPSPSDGLGWVRALHPMNAMLLVILSYQQARMAMEAGP